MSRQLGRERLEIDETFLEPRPSRFELEICYLKKTILEHMNRIKCLLHDSFLNYELDRQET